MPRSRLTMATAMAAALPLLLVPAALAAPAPTQIAKAPGFPLQAASVAEKSAPAKAPTPAPRRTSSWRNSIPPHPTSPPRPPSSRPRTTTRTRATGPASARPSNKSSPPAPARREAGSCARAAGGPVRLHQRSDRRQCLRDAIGRLHRSRGAGLRGPGKRRRSGPAGGPVPSFRADPHDLSRGVERHGLRRPGGPRVGNHYRYDCGNYAQAITLFQGMTQRLRRDRGRRRRRRWIWRSAWSGPCRPSTTRPGRASNNWRAPRTTRASGCGPRSGWPSCSSRWARRIRRAPC